jgi:hypothetical protein
MSRRKHLAARYPSGNIVRKSEPMPPTEVRRLVEQASAGLRDSVWSTMLGRIHLAGKLNTSQFSAGKYWTELTAAYAVACQSPRPPRTVLLDAPGGQPADPDSAKGLREAKRHERASLDYVEGRDVLRRAGRNIEHVVDHVCIQDCAPAGFYEYEALRTGLQALLAHWSAKRRR